MIVHTAAICSSCSILGHVGSEIRKLYVNLQTDDLVAQQARYSPMDALGARSGGHR